MRLSTEPQEGTRSVSKRVLLGAAATLVTLLCSLTLFLTPAYAGNVNGNVAFNDNATANLSDQTIVGEGVNNNVIITNDAQNAPSPTGFLMANAPVIGVIIIVLCGAALVVAKARKNSKEVE